MRALQLVGYLQEDDIPALDPTLGAFCALRAAIGDVLHGVEIGDTWLKQKDMDASRYPAPSKEQVERIVQDMQDRWSSLAKEVWAERVKRGDGVGRHEAAIAMAFIPRRTGAPGREHALRGRLPAATRDGKGPYPRCG